jgi:hypothetical protein
LPAGTDGTQLRDGKLKFLRTFEQRGRDKMGFINTLDIRIAMFQISHWSGGDPDPHCRIVLASSGKPALEPHTYAWSFISCLYGLNYSGPPTALPELYDPNPNWRAKFQFVYFDKTHLASLVT